MNWYDIIYHLPQTYFKDLNSNFFYFNQNIDWIYSALSTNFLYKIKIWYSSYFNFSNFFYYFWIYTYINLNNQLFYSILLDNYFYISNIYNPYLNDWVRSFLNSKQSYLTIIYHPELIWYLINSHKILYNNYLSNEDFLVYNNCIQEITINSYSVLLDLLVFISLISILIVLFFSFYNNINTEEKSIDIDYLNSFVTVESEKEITSIDDYLIVLLTISFVFGFYFFTHALFTIINQSNIMIVYYSLFIMFLFILGMPTFLLYDLGIYFLVYLKGVGKSANCFVEVVYDYIACVVFYTRIFAQWIRLVLMLVTYLSLSHYVCDFELTNNNLLLNELYSTNLNNIYYNNSSITYYLLTVLPFKFFYWIYEILHTLFLVTSQCIAFFAIVFWLILFLYTFFVVEKFEDFFSVKRLENLNKNSKILKLKQN